MSKIYRATDLIPLHIDELVVKISPLTYKQKMDIQGELLKGDARSAMNAAAMAVKCSVKDIQGLKDLEGNDYKLQFENGVITEACWDDLQNIQESQKLTLVCLNLINSVPREFVNPETGKKIEGVKIISEDKPSKKK